MIPVIAQCARIHSQKGLPATPLDVAAIKKLCWLWLDLLTSANIYQAVGYHWWHHIPSTGTTFLLAAFADGSRDALVVCS